MLIGLGAKNIVVPGAIPLGCVPRYLTLFPSDDPGDYDAAGCVRWLNEFAEEHNRALRRMLGRVPRGPAVAVVYADYYAAVMEIRSPATPASTVRTEPATPERNEAPAAANN